MTNMSILLRQYFAAVLWLLALSCSQSVVDMQAKLCHFVEQFFAMTKVSESKLWYVAMPGLLNVWLLIISIHIRHIDYVLTAGLKLWNQATPLTHQQTPQLY